MKYKTYKKIFWTVLVIVIIALTYLWWGAKNSKATSQPEIRPETKYVCHWDEGKRQYTIAKENKGHDGHEKDFDYKGKTDPKEDRDGASKWCNEEAPEFKEVIIKTNCDGTTDITVFTNTNRNWRVRYIDHADEHWINPYESYTWENIPGKYQLQWWDGKNPKHGKWKEADLESESYKVTYEKEECNVTTPAPEQPRGTTPAGAPQCTDSTPLVLPSNVHVVRSGADATVNFFTSSNNANIYFKEVHSANWEHSLRDIPVTGGYVSATIHDLDPNLGYTFGVQAANSCAGGETVLAVVVDGPQSVTFPFSYWEWMK